MSGGVLEVGTRDGNCPECGNRLITSLDDAAEDYDSRGRITRLEICPEWCPHCGWEPT